MKIVLLESLGISRESLEVYLEPLKTAGHVVECYERNEEANAERIKDADVAIVANMPLSGEAIKSAEKLKYIDVAFTGTDHIDAAAAKEKGVLISNASGYAVEAVAELTLGYAVALTRKLFAAQERCRNGRTAAGMDFSEIGGKTVGIIGTGSIGSRVAELFGFLGCRILGCNAFSRKKDTDLIHYVSLEDLLKNSDIVTLHCPLTPQSRGLLNARNLPLMKKSAVLINTARGPVVDTAALADALKSGAIAAAAVDVFDAEPPLLPDCPLLSAPNVLMTPHIGYNTREAMEKRAKIVFDNLQNWLNGRPINLVQ